MSSRVFFIVGNLAAVLLLVSMEVAAGRVKSGTATSERAATSKGEVGDDRGADVHPDQYGGYPGQGGGYGGYPGGCGGYPGGGRGYGGRGGDILAAALTAVAAGGTTADAAIKQAKQPRSSPKESLSTREASTTDSSVECSK